MVTNYRIAADHWTSDEAYNEMRAYHFHKHLLLMGHFAKYFPAEFALSPVLAALRQELESDATTTLRRRRETSAKPALGSQPSRSGPRPPPSPSRPQATAQGQAQPPVPVAAVFATSRPLPRRDA